MAQFANTDGGVLLVGVSERREEGRKVANAVVSVTDVDGEKQWVEQAIRNHLSPATFSRAIHEIVLPEGNVVAVNVPPSVHLVAHWAKSGKNGIEYLFRTDHGKQWFNPDEVETHIMNGSRAMQIKLDRLVAELSRQPQPPPPHPQPPVDAEVVPPAERFTWFRGQPAHVRGPAPDRSSRASYRGRD